MKFFRIALPAIVAGMLPLASAAIDKVDFRIQPKKVDWGKQAAAAAPVTVLRPAQATQGRAKALWDKFRKKLPEDNQLPAEGYLLETNAQGALIIVNDRDGLRWARQTLQELAYQAPVPEVQIADWPDQRFRAYHQIIYKPEALRALKKMVAEYLVPNRANMLILEIGYHFDFKSHPKVREPQYVTKAQIRDFVKYCRAWGVEVVPEINSIGHQSWKANGIHGLLRAYPELEEIPDNSSPQATLSHPDFYCRSYCPLHPKTLPTMTALFDEIIDAFGSRYFHIGADEVFVLASKKCPRCSKLSKAEVYAKAVSDLHAHLRRRGQTVMMWGDRLLDSRATKYSEWESSDNGTDGAIYKIPKDIIVCDWHYHEQMSYPSLRILTNAGFKVMPTTYQNLKGAKAFVRDGERNRKYGVTGVVATVWFSALEAASTLFPQVKAWKQSETAGSANSKTIMHTAKVTLVGGWDAGSMGNVKW